MLLTKPAPVSTQELASSLGITARMVRYSLESIEQWLAMQDIAVVKRPGFGIVIDAPPQIQKNLLRKVQQTENVSVSFSRSERLQILLLYLLTKTEPITAKELQQKLDVSRTTILKDLDRADQWLSNFALILDRCQNVGCEIRGEESQHRRAFVSTVLESIEEAQLLDILYDPNIPSVLSQMKQIGYIRALIRFLADLDLTDYNRLITDLCDQFGLKLLDRSYAGLVLDVAFQVSRFRKGKIVESAFADVWKQTDSKYTDMVRALAAGIKASRALTLIDPELGYLGRSLENASERRHEMTTEEKWNLDSQERQKLLEEISADILKKVEDFISAISLYLHPALRVDMELIRSLANHLHHIIHQKRPAGEIPNPLYKSVIKQYGYVTQLVSKHAYIFNTLLPQDLTDGEISYITMYVAAAMERLFIPSNRKRAIIVGDHLRATSSLLTSRLHNEFPNLEITGYLSYMDYHKDPFGCEHNLVIATSPINARSAPVVVVNPLLLPEDIARLEKYMHQSRDLAYPTSELTVPKHPTRDYHLKSLIDARTVQCKAEANSWEEVVDVATHSLFHNHKIEYRYIISIKEIIRKSGPYMVIWPHVVLLHALPEDGVRELCMSLTTLSKPVYFGHESHDPVEIAIVLGAIDKTSHLPALFELNELIQNLNAKENLINTYHKSKILAVVSSFKYSHSL